VVQGPDHEAGALLVAALGVVIPHPLGHGREQLLDAGLLGGRLDHADATGLPDSEQVIATGNSSASDRTDLMLP
jgi:hypothetical protein